MGKSIPRRRNVDNAISFTYANSGRFRFDTRAIARYRIKHPTAILVSLSLNTRQLFRQLFRQPRAGRLAEVVRACHRDTAA